MIRWAVPAAVVAALTLAVTGCGSSSKSADSTAASTPTTTTATSSDSSSSSDTSSSSGSTSTDTSSTDTSSSSSSSSSDTGSGSLATKCLAFAGVAAKLSQAFAASGGSGDTEAVKTYFQGLADKAPSDIKAAFQTVAEAYSKVIDAMKSANYKPGETPTAEQAAKLQQAAAQMDTAEVQAASTKINAWVKAGCK